MRASEVSGEHPGPLIALALFTLISLSLGVAANWFTSRKFGFLERYFLGNRSLGAIAVALTAAVMSGGTFLGFPSLVYSFGWVVGLWICSYMVTPLTVLGILGKRVGILARKTGAITLPELLRERFASPLLGLVTSVLVMVLLSVFLVAQFKAGAVVMMKVLPDSASSWIARSNLPEGIEPAYLVGLVIFTLTVVAYTTYGGFLAAIWTDVFQSIVMALGVVVLLPLALAAAGGLENATYRGMELAGDGFAFGPGANRNFLPLGLAFSYFVMWAISAMGQPSTIVRLMAFRDSRTLKTSIAYLAFYNAIVYIPLIIIFVCSRSILPDLKQPDEVMPTLVLKLSHPLVAGLILAAPYGAVMSTVSGFLLIIASGLVRDIYQRFLRPAASDREVARVSYAVMIVVGALVMLIAMKPPKYLQLIVVFASSAMATAFLVPVLLGCFWRRATAAGALAAMLAGTIATMCLYVGGMFLTHDQGIGAPPQGLVPYYLLGFEPVVWGLLASGLAGGLTSLLTRPPAAEVVSPLFDA